MARDRARSRSHSPRRRSRGGDGEGDHPRRRRSPAPSGLLVRNLPLSARPDDVRIPFERFGPVKDVYLPKDYNSGKLRGFGFVKYRYSDDAAEAKHKLNLSFIGGREIRIVYAEENRKTPQEMRSYSRPSGKYGGSHRRRTPSRSPRRRHHSSSRSPSPVRSRKCKNVDRYPVHSRSVSRSPSCDGTDARKYRSPRKNGKSRAEERNRYHSPGRSKSPVGSIHTPPGSRSRSYSPR